MSGLPEREDARRYSVLFGYQLITVCKIELMNSDEMYNVKITVFARGEKYRASG